MNNSRFSILLTIVAVGLWAWSVTQASLAIGFFGLIDSYPFTYFMALGLLSIASFILWLSREGHGKLLCLQVCLFIVMLWLTPILIGANPPSTVWTYAIYFPNSDILAQTGHFNASLHFDVYSAFYMQNWPGAFLFESALLKIAGASTVDFMALYSPIFTQFLILLPLYIFFKNSINNPNHRWAACWFFFLANWTTQLYFCPQAIGILFLITLLALLSRTAFWQNEGHSVGQQFSVILILAGLTITHLLTSIVAFLSVATLWVTRQVKGLNLTILAGVLVAFWLIYGAATQLQLSLPGYVERAFRLDLVFHLSALSGAGTASPSLLGVSYVRYIFTAVIAVMGLAGFLLSRRFKDKSDFPLLSLMASATLVLFSMLYGSEFWLRALLFALVPLSYFAAKMLRRKTSAAVMCALLLALLPFNIISHYGFAAVDYEPPAERAYWHFAVETAPPGDVFGGTRIYYPDFTYSRFYPAETSWKDGLLAFPTPSNNPVQYVHVGQTDRAAYRFALNDSLSVAQTQNELEGSASYSLIYANPSVNLYFHQYQQ
ncbi:MAG: hypothetical protein C4542_02710 [Dehalococcoidia bacterium]|nr:MAG: hypothetical protein C4542_02710 [Dehalococcoidia bacterium]